MPIVIERPQFTDGQILGADDLEQSLDYNRDQQSRHARTAHTWGIVDGLTIAVNGDNLEINPGMAIDSSGGTIVLAEIVVVVKGEFTDQLGNADGTYPVFLLANHEQAAGAQSAGRCGTGSAGRVREGGLIQFGRPTDVVGWDLQNPWPIGNGPDDERPVSDRRVLLGFVTWKSADGGKFDSAGQNTSIDGVEFRPRFAGIKADEITAVSGRLLARARPLGTPESPILQMDADPADDEKTILSFGVDDGLGNIRDKPLLTLNADGDLKIQGALTSKSRTGETRIQSGQATDGMTLPLPPGVLMSQVESGSVTLHAIVNPRPDLSTSPDPTQLNLFAVADECRVDENLRVHCRFRWLNATDTTTWAQLPIVGYGVCDYVLIAAVPPEGGGA